MNESPTVLLIKLIENSASGFVVITAMGLYFFYKSGILSRFLGNGKPEPATEKYRRLGDEEMSRLATAIETLNQILREVSLTQKDMAHLLERQQRDMDGAIVMQKDMKDTQDDLLRKVKQIHGAVVSGTT